MTQAYRVLKDAELNTDAKPGTIVYKSAGYDYGLAVDDTRATGIEHISVTLKRSGGYPSFTMPLHDLEPFVAEPLPSLTYEHVMAVCRPGAGHETCRYLTMSPDWSCEKQWSLSAVLDNRVAEGSMVAHGDNCEGRS